MSMRVGLLLFGSDVIDKVAVEGRPSTVSLSKPCVRLSPHTAFPFGVAFIDALDVYTHHFACYPLLVFRTLKRFRGFRDSFQAPNLTFSSFFFLAGLPSQVRLGTIQLSK